MDFICESCKYAIALPESAIGKRVKCPKCHAISIVYEPIPEPVIKAEEPIKILPEEVKQIDAEESNSFRKCPYCGEMILENAKKCKHCGEFFDGLTRQPIIVQQINQDDCPWPQSTFIIYIILTVLIPLIGLIIGIYGANQKSKESQGYTLIIISVVSIVISAAIYAGTF